MSWADDDWETLKGLNKESVTVQLEFLMIIRSSGTVHRLKENLQQRKLWPRLKQNHKC